MRCPPQGQAPLQCLLAGVCQFQKPPPHLRTFRDRDHSFFLQQPKAASEGAAIEHKHFREGAHVDGLQFDDTHKNGELSRSNAGLLHNGVVQASDDPGGSPKVETGAITRSG